MSGLVLEVVDQVNKQEQQTTSFGHEAGHVKSTARFFPRSIISNNIMTVLQLRKIMYAALDRYMRPSSDNIT